MIENYIKLILLNNREQACSSWIIKIALTLQSIGNHKPTALFTQ